MYKVAEVLGLGLAFALVVTNAALADAISLPEPSSMSVFAFGAVGVLIARKFKQRK